MKEEEKAEVTQHARIVGGIDEVVTEWLRHVLVDLSVEVAVEDVEFGTVEHGVEGIQTHDALPLHIRTRFVLIDERLAPLQRHDLLEISTRTTRTQASMNGDVVFSRVL